jgi:hypothetical protein
MRTSEPATRPARPVAIQPWAISLVAVVLILVLLVGLTI